jgi:hypothetical protein
METQVTAVVLARTANDANQLIELVSRQIAAAWPEAVRLKRRGLFKTGRVVGTEIRLGRVHYELDIVDGRPVATIADAHGGIALSHTEVSIEEWTRRLVGDLATLAGQIESARSALTRLSAS